MSVFGGEFIRRLLKALEGATLAPIAEVDETDCADALKLGALQQTNFTRGTRG